MDLEACLCFFFTASWLPSAPIGADGDDIFATPRCSAFNKVAVGIVLLLPFIWRLFQTLRRYYDTGDRFPHFFNSLKVCSSGMLS